MSRSVEGSQLERGGLTDASPRTGVVYTRPAIVRLCLQIARNACSGTFLDKRILDVGCGYGQFLVPLALDLVREVSRVDGPDGVSRYLRRFLRGIEIRPETAELTRRHLADSIRRSTGKRLSPRSVETIVRCGDILQWECDEAPFDIVVGNLPYVRHDQIDRLKGTLGVHELRERFASFRGRADYSLPVLERALDLLSPSGTAVLLTSNRFTRSEYGKSIRRILALSGRRVHEVDLTQVNAFQSEVSAYASVFLLSSKSGSRRTAPMYVRLLKNDQRVLEVVGAGFPSRLRDGGGYKVVRRRSLSRDGSPWGTIPRSVQTMLERLCRSFTHLGALGVDVRKGPATGADRVFVGTLERFEFDQSIASDFLLPLFDWGMQSARSGPALRYLLSVYRRGTTTLLGLRELPRQVRRYLQRHRSVLEKRHVVAKGRRQWWATIDAFDPLLLEQPKVLVPDLRPADRTTMDLGDYFPAHSVVSVAGDDISLLRGVHAVLSSPIAEEFRFWRSPDLGPQSPRASVRVIRGLPMPPAEQLIAMGRNGGGFGAVSEVMGLSDSETAELLERQISRQASGS